MANGVPRTGSYRWLKRQAARTPPVARAGFIRSGFSFLSLHPFVHRDFFLMGLFLVACFVHGKFTEECAPESRRPHHFSRVHWRGMNCPPMTNRDAESEDGEPAMSITAGKWKSLNRNIARYETVAYVKTSLGMDAVARPRQRICRWLWIWRPHVFTMELRALSVSALSRNH